MPLPGGGLPDEGALADTREREEILFPVCATVEQLDCLESIRVFREGVELPVDFVSERPAEASSSWVYPDTDGGDVKLEAQFFAWIPPGLWITVAREPDEEHPYRPYESLDCSSGNKLDCVEGFPPLPEGDRVQMTVRTSWLRFMGAGIQGHDIGFSRRPYPGGERFVISGRQNLLVMPQSFEGPVDSWVARSFEARLYAVLAHAGSGKGDEAYDPRCLDKGAPVSGINAPNAGQPSWQESTQSLQFGVFAPHLGPDGKRYVGNFEAKFPLAWLRCQANKPRLNIGGFEVQVWNEDGEEQAATTSLRVRKGVVSIVATNFHYSSPRIVLTKK